jgi:hypothetical protein
MKSKPFVWAILVLGMAQLANAQVGSGWTSITLAKHTDVDGCGSISGSTHKISCSTTGSAWQRAEYKLGASTSGHRQFQGDFKVVSLGGTGITIKQTFKAPSSAFFMLAVKAGGVLYQHGAGTTFATDIIGKTYRVNTTIGGGEHRFYLNGSLKKTQSASGAFFDKYGAYKSASGKGPATVQWTGIKSWKK